MVGTVRNPFKTATIAWKEKLNKICSCKRVWLKGGEIIKIVPTAR